MKKDKIMGAIFWLLTVQVVMAQIPIEKEPHHRVILENQQVRVIELIVSAQDTTLLHTHNAASVVIFLSASSFAIQNPKQAPVVTSVKPGDVIYRDYDVKPVAHTVWSTDRMTFRCLVVELK